MSSPAPDCALVSGLRERFGLDDPAGALQAVAGQFHVDVALPSLDLAGLGDITRRLGLDTGPLQAGSSEVLGRLGGVAGGIDPTGLIRPLLQLVEQAEQLSQADPAAVLARIAARVQSGGTGNGADQGLAKLQRVLGDVGAATREPALQGVLGLGRALLPALPESPLAPLGAWGGGLTSFVALAGGLMAVESRSRLIEHGPASARERLAPLRRKRLDVLLAWGDSQLPEQLTASPDDPALAKQLAAYLVELDDTVRVLEDAVGTAELALAYDDPQRAAAQLVALEPLLEGTPAEPLQDLCEQLVERLSPPLASAAAATGGASLDAGINAALAQLGQLEAALAALDATALAAPVRNAIGALTGGLQGVADGIGSGVGAITLALHAVRDAVAAIDLRPLTDMVRALLQPVVDALQALDELLADVMDAIGDAMDLARGAITAVRDGILGAAEAIRQAFDQVAAAVQALDLAGKVAALQGGIQAVASELERIRLEPFFDTSRDVMETAADALRLVPVDLLPDDLRQKLAEVSATVRAINFENQVRTPLNQQWQTLRSALDTDVLGQIDTFHQQLVTFLNQIDPEAPLRELEARFDADLIAPLLALDPDQMLAPVSQALQQVRRQIAAIDLGSTVLQPVEQVFASLLAAVDQADPAQVLAPLVNRLAQARAQIETALGLQQWADTLDQSHAALQGVLDRLDLAVLLPRLESAYQLLLAGLRDIPGGGPLGSVVTLLMQKALPVGADSWPEVMRWLAEGGAAGVVQARVAAAQTALVQIGLDLGALDVPGAAARLTPMHNRLNTALAALAADHPLRQRFGAALAQAPAQRLAALQAAQQRLQGLLAGANAALAPLAASGFSHTDLARDRLRQALTPLTSLQQQLIALCLRFGVDPRGRDLGAVFAQILAALRPSRVLAALAPLVTLVKTKLGDLVRLGLVEPLQAGIAALRDILARIDLTPVVAELSAIHAAVRAQIEALNPVPLLQGVLGAFDTLRDHLAAYDPLEPARDAINTFKAAVADLARPDSPVRPTVLFHGAVLAHHDITQAVAGIDVRNLLRPVFDALDALAEQLDAGLAGSEAAFADLQAALPAA
ncbi:MAG: hypothetical protein RIQ60_689 [Pseudomonadota bacterium]|jgi:hypothetical protein